MDRRTRLDIVISAVIVCAYFLYSAYGGLRAHLTTDDLMNLYGYWTKPAWQLLVNNVLYFSPSYRPIGGLFYVPLFSIFGFNSFPYRLVCYALLLLNLLILWALVRSLRGSRQQAFAAVTIAAYHPAYVYLYYNTGTVYDLLCFFFYFSAITWYVRIRSKGRLLRARDIGLLLFLYICALNSKEMAVTLPLAVLTFELIYHPPEFLTLTSIARWIRREGSLSLYTAAVTVPYVIGKVSSASPFAGHPGYTPDVSVERYLANYGSYLDQIFYASGYFGPAVVAGLLCLVVLLAIAARRRDLLWWGIMMVISFLPIAFIGVRGAYAFYIPFASWAAVAGSVVTITYFTCVRLARAAVALARGGKKGSPAARSRNGLADGSLALVFVMVLLLVRAHRVQRSWIVSEEAIGWPGLELQQAVYSVKEQLQTMCPSMPQGARILFLDDPFRDYDSTLMFLCRFLYRDFSISVKRAKVMSQAPDRAGYTAYDYVFTFQDRRLYCVSGIGRRARRNDHLDAHRPGGSERGEAGK